MPSKFPTPSSVMNRIKQGYGQLATRTQQTIQAPYKQSFWDKPNQFLDKLIQPQVDKMAQARRKMVGPAGAITFAPEAALDVLIRKDTGKSLGQRFSEAGERGGDIWGALETRGMPTKYAMPLGLAAAIALPGAGELSAISKANKLSKLSGKTDDISKLASKTDDLAQEARKYKSAEELKKIPTGDDFNIDINKVGMKTGEPALIKSYHGTNRKFEKFDINAKPSGRGKYSGEGIYFTPSKEGAKNFGDRVVESYLDIKNPYVKYLPEGNIDAQFLEEAREAGLKGYDAIIVRSKDTTSGDWTDGGVLHKKGEIVGDWINEIVVLDSSVIKTKSQITKALQSQKISTPTKIQEPTLKPQQGKIANEGLKESRIRSSSDDIIPQDIYNQAKGVGGVGEVKLNIIDKPVYNEPSYISKLKDPIAKDTQRRIVAGQDMVAEIKATELPKSLNKDGTITIFHGTSNEAADSILKSGKFDTETYFSPLKSKSAFGSEGAEQYVKNKFGNKGQVLEIKVDARDVNFNSGTGEVEAMSGLVRGRDGIWRSPERYVLPQPVGGVGEVLYRAEQPGKVGTNRRGTFLTPDKKIASNYGENVKGYSLADLKPTEKVSYPSSFSAYKELQPNGKYSNFIDYTLASSNPKVDAKSLYKNYVNEFGYIDEFRLKQDIAKKSGLSLEQLDLKNVQREVDKVVANSLKKKGVKVVEYTQPNEIGYTDISTGNKEFQVLDQSILKPQPVGGAKLPVAFGAMGALGLSQKKDDKNNIMQTILNSPQGFPMRPSFYAR